MRAPWCWWVCPPPFAYVSLRLAGLAEVAYGLLVIFAYEFDSPFLNLSHGLGVLHPEFVFHLSLVISCFFLSGPTGHLSLACLLRAGSEDFGSHPFNHLSS